MTPALHVAKNYLRRHPRAYDVAKRGKRLCETLTGTLPQEYLLFRSIAFSCPSISFIQIGASDGMMNDPLREFIVSSQWKGLLVEPSPFAFQQLVDGYKYLRTTRLKFVNAGIGIKRSSQGEFWTFRPVVLEGADPAARVELLQKSSFDRSAFQRNLRALGLEFDDVAMALPIKMLPLTELLQEHSGFSQAELLVIDAEGYDEEIIRQVNFEVFRPSVLYFETLFLDKDDVGQLLDRHGYIVCDLGANAVAIERSFLMRCKRLSGWLATQ